MASRDFSTVIIFDQDVIFSLFMWPRPRLEFKSSSHKDRWRDGGYILCCFVKLELFVGLIISDERQAHHKKSTKGSEE